MPWRRPAERRYSPATCTRTREQAITGNPDPAHISTSHVEGQNLTMRLSMRRFTRLTNAVSKKVVGRVHETLRVTPAMEAGASDQVWSLEEIAGLAE